MAHSYITLTTAQIGSGKSFRRCSVYLVEEWLKDRKFLLHLKDGSERIAAHWSNFPIRRDAMAEAVAKRFSISRATFDEAVREIPSSEIERWRRQESGPWDFFHSQDITGCHIAIDEIHVFCGKGASKEHKQRWSSWLGEIRHQGATVELITQHVEKCAREIVNEATINLQLVNSETRRDPLFGIRLGDWYELRAKFLTRQYTSAVWEIEKRDVDGKKVVQDKRIFPLDPYYFHFYDSYSKPQAGGGAASVATKREFQKRGVLSLLLWFLGRNALRLLWRGALIAGVVFMLSGGGAYIFPLFLENFTGGIVKAARSKPAEVRKVEPPRVTPAFEGSPVASAIADPPPTSQPMGQVVERKFKELSAQLAAAQKEVAAMKERESRSTALVLVTPTDVTFRSGYTYRLGDMIDFGPYEGRRVVLIWFERRAVKLDNGQWLRMRDDGK